MVSGQRPALPAPPSVVSGILIESIYGGRILGQREAIAALRIEVFREWPYLYDGTIRYEEAYLKHYADCPQSIVVLAKDGDAVVGASTGLPLASAAAEFGKAFAGSPYAVDEIYYFGESVLLPGYRGRGIGHRFFDEREAQARRCGARFAAFCAVDREPDDSRRPHGYRALDPFWEKRGFIKLPEIQARLSWRETSRSTDSPHSLTFWIKELKPAAGRP